MTSLLAKPQDEAWRYVAKAFGECLQTAASLGCRTSRWYQRAQRIQQKTEQCRNVGLLYRTLTATVSKSRSHREISGLIGSSVAEVVVRRNSSPHQYPHQLRWYAPAIHSNTPHFSLVNPDLLAEVLISLLVQSGVSKQTGRKRSIGLIREIERNPGRTENRLFNMSFRSASVSRSRDRNRRSGERKTACRPGNHRRVWQSSVSSNSTLPKVHHKGRSSSRQPDASRPIPTLHQNS
jgi:hypothetical protein